MVAFRSHGRAEPLALRLARRGAARAAALPLSPVGHRAPLRLGGTIPGDGSTNCIRNSSARAATTGTRRWWSAACPAIAAATPWSPVLPDYCRIERIHLPLARDGTTVDMQLALSIFHKT
jgi:hypothetical protein